MYEILEATSIEDIFSELSQRQDGIEWFASAYSE